MKIIKLLLLAVVVLGGIAGIVYISGNNDGTVSVSSVKSVIGEKWKNKINDLCKENTWTSTGYQIIETGMQLDSNQNNLDMSEHAALKKYLFAKSCESIKDGTDKLFQQSNYPSGRLSYFENAISFLNSHKNDPNSNLGTASSLFAAYHQIMKSFGGNNVTASYSRPLRAYSGSSASGRKQRIVSMPYYKTHFSKNASIRSKVERMGNDSQQSEQTYYANLERCIEAHYRSSGDITILLEDQMRFNEISTNFSAKERLRQFIESN